MLKQIPGYGRIFSFVLAGLNMRELKVMNWESVMNFLKGVLVYGL